MTRIAELEAPLIDYLAAARIRHEEASRLVEILEQQWLEGDRGQALTNALRHCRAEQQLAAQAEYELVRRLTDIRRRVVVLESPASRIWAN